MTPGEGVADHLLKVVSIEKPVTRYDVTGFFIFKKPACDLAFVEHRYLYGGTKTELVPMMPPESSYEGWPKFAGARNVARNYERLFNDLNKGTKTAPTFDDAVALHELLDSIEQSARK